MTDVTIECAYLGGHHSLTPSQAVLGRIKLSDTRLDFETFGEYAERLFAIEWSDVTWMAADGSNVATRTMSAGRMLAGALIAGLPGALIGSLAKREEYETALIVDTALDHVGLVLKGHSPVALMGILRTFPAAAVALSRSASDATAGGVTAPTKWSYRTGGLDDLDAAGAEGWEAVGVWVDGAPQVLMKRPIVEL